MMGGKKRRRRREHYNKEFYSTFIRHPSTLFKKRAIKHYHLPLRFLFFFSLGKFMNSSLPFYHTSVQIPYSIRLRGKTLPCFISFVLAVHLLMLCSALETKNSYFFLFYCSQLTFTTVLHYSFISIEVRIIIYEGDEMLGMAAEQQEQTKSTVVLVEETF